MNDIFTSLSMGLTAFTTTNLDDVLILLLFFSQVSATFGRRQIIAGQYLGFTALVLASLPTFFSSLIFPRPWIGLLGILPIAIGLNRLFNPEDGTEDDLTRSAMSTPEPRWWNSILSPQTYSVAAITLANGGDNVGIYMPLFASCSWERLLVVLAVFFSLVGVWCYVAYRLTTVPAIAEMLTRYGNTLVPFVLIGLGILILIDSRTLENRGLAVLTLVIGGSWLMTLWGNVSDRVANLVADRGTLAEVGSDAEKL